MEIKSYLYSALDAIYFLKSREWLLIICSAVFSMSSGMGLTNPVLSLYARGFGVSTTQVGLFITMFAVGRIFVTILAGRAADRWGRKLLMVSGAFIVAIGSLGIALATGYIALVVFRMLQGMGSGLYMSSSILVVADLAVPEERGRVTSLFQGSIQFGLAISPIVGGTLASAIDIRTPILVHVFLAIIVALLLIFHFPSHLGKVNIEKPQKKEAETEQTSATKRILTDANFILIALVAFLIFVGRAGSRDTLMPLIGNSELGLDTGALGVMFSVISLSNLFTIPLAGIVADNRGRKVAIIAGLLLSALSLFFIGLGTSILWFFLGAVLMGIGKGFGEPMSIVYVTDISPAGKYGTSFGLFLTLRDLGLFTGPVALSWIADNAGLRLPFIVNGLAMVGCAVLFGMIAMETLHIPRNHVPSHSPD